METVSDDELLRNSNAQKAKALVNAPNFLNNKAAALFSEITKVNGVSPKAEVAVDNPKSAFKFVDKIAEIDL